MLPAQQEVTGEELYGTQDIYASGTTLLNQDIYGTFPPLPNQNIYGIEPSGTDIYGAAYINENTLSPGGDIHARKSKNIIPPIISGPSTLSPIIPLETTLSSTFIKLSSTKLNDPNSNTNAKASSRPNTSKNSSPIHSSRKGKRDKNTRFKSPNSAFIIPQSSKLTPVIKQPKIKPVVKPDTAVPRTSTSKLTPKPTFQPSLIKNNLDSPKAPAFVTNDPATDTVIKSFYDLGETSGFGTDVASSDLVPVSILRRSPSPNPRDHAVPQPSILSGMPKLTLHGNESLRRQSVNHHPNMPRYSIDFSGLHNLVNPPKPVRIPSYPKLIPIPHKPKETPR